MGVGTQAQQLREKMINQSLAYESPLPPLPTAAEPPTRLLPSGRDTLSPTGKEPTSRGPVASISEETPLVLGTGPRSGAAHARGTPGSPSATGVTNWSSGGWMGSLSLSPASRELVESNVVQPGAWDSKAMRPGWKGGGWKTLTEYLATGSKTCKNPDEPIWHLCPPPTPPLFNHWELTWHSPLATEQDGHK